MNKKPTTDFKMIKIADIVIGNTNPRKEFDKEAINELAKSITANGVIQPIVLRPGKKKGYELVCGERRHRASIIAKLIEIPAIIKELTDDQALELQITENLQRKDIHPMDEAVAFKHWQEMKKYTIPDIAKRVGKSEKYVAGRLKLNGLIAEFQKMLYNNNLKLSDALSLLKLSPDTQKEFYTAEVKGNTGEFNFDDYYNFDEYFGELSDAPFNIKDATLKKEMGPCTTCQFNSANSLLFADEKKPHCGLLKCFTEKSKISFDREIKKALEDESVILVNTNYYKDEENKNFTKQGYRVLERNGFNTTNKSDKAAKKAFVVSGQEKGTYIYIKFITGGGPKSQSNLTSSEVTDLMKEGKATPAMIDDEISKIKERLKHGGELIEETIAGEMYKALETLEETKPGTFVHNKALNNCETVGLIFILKKKCYGDVDDILNKYKIEDGEEDLYTALMNTTPDKLEELIRLFTRQAIIDTFSPPKGATPQNDFKVLCIEDCMKRYAPAKQKEIRESHQERAKSKATNAALKIEKLQLAKKTTKSPEKENTKTAKS